MSAPAPAPAAASPASLTSVARVAMTLDLRPGAVDEYVAAHAAPRPPVVRALRAVGLRNLSLWVWRERLFYYAEFVPVGDETFADAMRRYAAMPGGTRAPRFSPARAGGSVLDRGADLLFASSSSCLLPLLVKLQCRSGKM